MASNYDALNNWALLSVTHYSNDVASTNPGSYISFHINGNHIVTFNTTEPLFEKIYILGAPPGHDDGLTSRDIYIDNFTIYNYSKYPYYIDSSNVTGNNYNINTTK